MSLENNAINVTTIYIGNKDFAFFSHLLLLYEE